VLVLGSGCRESSANGTGGAPPSVTADTTPANEAGTAVMGAMVATNVTWGDLHSRGDASGLAALYTEDAVLMRAGDDVVGRAAILKHFQGVVRTRPDSILATSTATETIDVAGDRAYEAGTVIYTVRPRADPTAAPREIQIRYVNFWQRQPDGRWLIRRSHRIP
jgi:uncharacterized protein (TIGR02246 family)